MIVIEGRPIPKARPRMTRRGIAYNSQKGVQDRVTMEIKAKFDGEPLDGAVEIHIVFFMPIPKGTPKKVQLAGMPHTKRPDLDNLEKFIVDCCNGILFKDDSQITESHTMKIYGNPPRTEITVKGINIDEVI